MTIIRWRLVAVFLVAIAMTAAAACVDGPEPTPIISQPGLPDLQTGIGSNLPVDESDASLGGIPSNAQYQIRIDGQGSFSGATGQAFALEGFLLITPTIDPQSQLLGNTSVNPIDVGVFTNDSPLVGRAGALYFGTNTSLSSVVGSNLGASQLDIATVTVDPANSTVVAELNGNAFGLPTARVGTFNIYNLTSGLTAQVHHILAGRVVFEITDGGNGVRGIINLGGSSGSGGPNVSSEYLGTFRGVRVQ